jgi:hypothetical protein
MKQPFTSHISTCDMISDMDTQHFWQFCDQARCTPTAPDINLAIIHKNFHKHPRKHELRAQWVVDRAKKISNITLDLASVIEASKREEQDHRDADKHTIMTINLIK